MFWFINSFWFITFYQMQIPGSGMLDIDGTDTQQQVPGGPMVDSR